MIMFQIKDKIIRLLDYLTFGETDWLEVEPIYNSSYDNYETIYEYMKANYNDLPVEHQLIFDNADSEYGKLNTLYDINFFDSNGDISLPDIPLLLTYNVNFKNNNPNTINNTGLVTFELTFITYQDNFFDIENYFLTPFIKYIDRYDTDILLDSITYANEENNIFGIKLDISFITTLKY